MERNAGLKRNLEGACTQNQMFLKPVKSRPLAPAPNKRRLRSNTQLAKTVDPFAIAETCKSPIAPQGTAAAGQGRSQPVEAKMLAPVPLQPVENSLQQTNTTAFVSKAQQRAVDGNWKNKSLEGMLYKTLWPQNLDIAMDQASASLPMLPAQHKLQQHRAYEPYACHQKAMGVTPSVPDLDEQVSHTHAAAAISTSLSRHMSLSGWPRSLVHSNLALRLAPESHKQSHQLLLQSAQQQLQPDARVTACKKHIAMGTGPAAVTLSDSCRRHQSFVQVLLSWNPTQGPHHGVQNTTGYLECKLNIQHKERQSSDASETHAVQRSQTCGASPAAKHEYTSHPHLKDFHPQLRLVAPGPNVGCANCDCNPQNCHGSLTY